jgi:DNA-binding FadR family transcriptional regulator
MPDLIDPTSDRPVYRQIADHLRQAIRDGQYGEGDALPSEAAMAETYGVTRMTARQAIEVLKTEGLVRSEHGRGSSSASARRSTGWPVTASPRRGASGRAARAPTTWRSRSGCGSSRTTRR